MKKLLYIFIELKTLDTFTTHNIYTEDKLSNSMPILLSGIFTLKIDGFNISLNKTVVNDKNCFVIKIHTL